MYCVFISRVYFTIYIIHLLVQGGENREFVLDLTKLTDCGTQSRYLIRHKA